MCHSRDYILTNPSADIKLPSQKRREIRWLDQNKVKKLLKAVKGHALEGPVRVILGLGLRRSEMINLEWRDINFEVDIVRARGTKTQSAFREIPIPKMLIKYFRTLNQTDDMPSRLCSTNGQPWNKSSLNSSLRRLRAADYISFDWNF